MNNRKAQTESGPLQKLMILLIIISVMAVLCLSFLTSVSNNYNKTLTDDSVFTELDQHDKALNRTNEIRNALRDVSGPVDIIGGIVTGGYNVLALFLSDIPSDFNGMINSITGPAGLELPSIVTNFLFVIIIIIVVFAVLALIMKIRA